MTPSELKDEMGFEELCRISTASELPAKPVAPIVSAAEAISKIDRERAVGEERNIRLSYSLFCQSNAHHNCHSLTCGCLCHAEERNSATSTKIPERFTDPYWQSRLGRPVGSTDPGNVGWRGYANDPAASEKPLDREGTSPTLLHTAGTVLRVGDLDLGERVDQAFNTLDRLEREGRGRSGEAARLQRMLLTSGVEPESNWRAANRARRLEEGRKEVDLVIAPSRIQTCPFPASRKIILVDDTGVAVNAYIPEEETK